MKQWFAYVGQEVIDWVWAKDEEEARSEVTRHLQMMKRYEDLGEWHVTGRAVREREGGIR